MKRVSRTEAAGWLLAGLLPPLDVEIVLGDLEEEFSSRDEPSRSDAWFWAQIVRSAPHFAWLSIRQGGIASTFGVAVAALLLQALVEIATGLIIHALSLRNPWWTPATALPVMLVALLSLSYSATRIRPGAAAAIAGIATIVQSVSLVGAMSAGHSVPVLTVAAMFTVPAVAYAGGWLSLRGLQRDV